MKTIALAILALTILTGSAFAADSTSATAPQSESSSFMNMPESLQRAIIWSRLLSFTPEGGLNVVLLGQYAQAVDRAIEAIKAHRDGR
jgi:hypothetical protein